MVNFKNVFQSVPTNDNALHAVASCGIISDNTMNALFRDVNKTQLDLKFLSSGTFALVFKPENSQRMVVRLSNNDTPASSAIVLKPVERKEYTYSGEPKGVVEDDGHIQLSVMPYVPDLPSLA
jgi:hypothetical protein